MNIKEQIQNNPEQQARIRTNELLVDAGTACTKEMIERVRRSADEARHASRLLQQLSPEIIYNAGCGDLRQRAERNATALVMLLSSAADAAEYLNYEIYGILKAIEQEEKRRLKQSIEMAKERKQADAKHREYERAKIKRAKQLGATIDEAIQAV